MKYINFKRYKFSTVFKNINFKRYNLNKIYKYIDFRRYNFPKISKYFDYRGLNFNKFYKYFDYRRLNFSKVIRYFDYRRLNFSKVLRYFDYRRLRYFDYRRLNFSKVYKNLNLNKFRYIPFYIFGTLVFSALIYLSLPIFFKYNKTNIENIVCKELNIECSIQGKINYSFLPSPRIKISNFIIKDFTNENKNIGTIKNVEIKISLYNLHNKEKFNYTKIKLTNADFNFNLKEIKEYKKFYKKNFSSKPISLTKGKINFYEGKTSVAAIEHVYFKYTHEKKGDQGVLKGKFLEDDLFISLESKQEADKVSKFITLKLSDLKLLTKINLIKSISEKNSLNGNILFKKDKNRLRATFDYKDNKIFFKDGDIRNVFLDGKFNGYLTFLPYFNFDLNMDLNGVNFNRLHSSLISLNKENKKKLFEVNKKINGKLNLSVEKIFSKHTLVSALESRITFTNGNILIDQLILNMGKLGAADVIGVISNNKFSNLKFEKNIFFDNLKRFYNKFGIFNKKKLTSNLFVSGNLDLTNMQLRLYEIFTDKKLNEEDLTFIEQEFNDALLTDGYASLFNFFRLKEFIKSITTETN